MVSFWPWKGDTSSTASFEKLLSALSTKIATTQTRLDAIRQASRRRKVLSAFILLSLYLFYTVVIFVVVGAKNTGPWEWTGLAGGPVVIYGVRASIAAVDNYRIESFSNRLKEYQEQRAATIQKLKDATKYDSTLELIEKYGGEKKKKEEEDKTNQQNNGNNQQGRTAGKQRQNPDRLPYNPGPTANIQRRPSQTKEIQPTAEFAPNAESPRPPSSSHSNRPFAGGPQNQSQPRPPPPYAAQHLPPAESHWYDRIFDALLGEDETLPKNRIVLLCAHCRLVNGQAPPGTQSLADLGMWRCMGCGGQNGETREDEGKRVVREALEENDNEPKDAEMIEVGDKEPKEEEEEQEQENVKAEEEIEGPAAAAVRRRRGKA